MSIAKEYNGCRSRTCLEGSLSRRRTYHCRICNEKYHVDTLDALPVEERICQDCQSAKNLLTDNKLYDHC